MVSGTGRFSVPSIDPTSDTLPRSIKQNSDGKITFRLPSGYASDVAIDEHGAEKLPSDVKGRALYKTHELKEMQVPLIEDKEMWERLAQYQSRGVNCNESINEYREEEKTTRGNFVEFVDDEVRDKGTTSKTSQSGKRSKRTKNPKPDKGIPTRSESPGEERLLPKRKRKGISRKFDGSEMEPPS